MATITVTRALAELKTLDSRINKAIQGMQLIALTTGKRAVSGYQTNDEFITKAKSTSQSISDLIKNRNEIKSKIVISNAEKKVKIGNCEYTVAEAIERKNGIQYEQNLLAKMKNDYVTIIAKFEREEEKVKARLDEHLKSMFNNSSKKTEQDEESKVFLERNQPVIIDPLGLKNQIEELEKQIDEFVTNVDFSLSESNSINTIEISD